MPELVNVDRIYKHGLFESFLNFAFQAAYIRWCGG